MVALFLSNCYAESGTTSAKTIVPKRATEVLWLAINATRGFRYVLYVKVLHCIRDASFRYLLDIY
jgi:hypothetical protein